MKQPPILLFTLALLVGSVTTAPAQQRPIPDPVVPPPRWEAAVESGTRTTNGTPGPSYWTNRAHYDIEATLSPETRTLRGRATITYANRSPDSLEQLVVHLRQNIYKEGSARRTALATPGGMHLAHVAVNGQPLAERPRSTETGYDVHNTVMRIDPPSDVAPGDTVQLDLAWSYKLRKKGPSPRQGTDGEVFFIAYWYPHMTLVESFVGGGMEYPMVTILHGAGSTPKGLYSTALHEIAHQWFPMMVGSEETDHIWMDEGLVTYWTREGQMAFWEEEMDPWAPTSGYFDRAGTARETAPWRHGDLFPSVGALVVASYDKTGRMLRALEGLAGSEAFRTAFRTYAERWTQKHPYPYDLFNTFEAELGRDLDWFWRSVLDETWTLDQAVARVASTDEGVVVTVDDQGRMPMPVLLEATYADGSTASARIPVDVWLQGNREATTTLPPGTVTRVEIDPQGYFPDIDRDDNTWTQD